MLLDLVTIIYSTTKTTIMKYNVFPCIWTCIIIVYSATIWWKDVTHQVHFLVIAELWRAKRACGAPWVRKCGKLPIRENLVITWPYTDRPSAPQAYQCLLSHFLATLGAQEKTDCTSMLWSIDSCQNKVPLTSIAWPYHGLRCRPILVEYFFEVIRWQVTSFQMITGSSLFFKIHIKYVVFMSLWPSRTWKFGHLFKNASREDRCFFVFSP